MCEECWEDKYSKAAIVNGRTKEMSQRIKRLYERPGCGCGGTLHIVLDDWNLDDNSINFCIEDMKPDEHAYKVEMRLARALLDMLPQERASALAIKDGFINVGKGGVP